jgi:hypothetical protein
MIITRMMWAIGGMLLVLFGITCVGYIALHSLTGISIADYQPRNGALLVWFIVGAIATFVGFFIIDCVHDQYKIDVNRS